jgi:hypothetical protein
VLFSQKKDFSKKKDSRGFGKFRNAEGQGSAPKTAEAAPKIMTPKLASPIPK